MSMEARFLHWVAALACVFSLGAGYRTTNFFVQAKTTSLAHEVGDAAEAYRKSLALQWLGKELPRWSRPCPITVHVGPRLGAGGTTSFVFDRGQPGDWEMSIQGSQERILDSVLPHEITHTIFATHFGRPLPRWADEGACTTVEHGSEKQKQYTNLLTYLTTGRGIAFNRMFGMKDYPQDILPLYAQGFSLTRFLIAQRGRSHFMEYLGRGMTSNDWPTVTREYYGYRNLGQLQLTWIDWVRQGSPLQLTPNTQLAATTMETAMETTTETQPASYYQQLADGVEELPKRASEQSRESRNTTEDFFAQNPASLLDQTPQQLRPVPSPRVMASPRQSPAGRNRPSPSPPGSWYAKGTQPSRTASSPANRPTTQMATRLPAAQGVQETVLDWGDSGAWRPGATSSYQIRPSSAYTPYDSRQTTQGTILR